MADKKTGIDQALIRDLANILNDTDLTEIEVEQDDLRIRVSRNGTPVMMPQQMQGYSFQAPAAPAPAAAPAAVAAPAAPAGRDLSKAVTAPMVGTVYLSPAPGARPVIEVGSTVKEGQTLLIIEAMKTMNQIPSPKSGKVVEIVIDDASPVEYGEPLVIIE
jgi:acetyl-CoA carboxylase biotin carboxyl carrier protein